MVTHVCCKLFEHPTVAGLARVQNVLSQTTEFLRIQLRWSWDRLQQSHGVVVEHGLGFVL